MPSLFDYYSAKINLLSILPKSYKTVKSIVFLYYLEKAEYLGNSPDIKGDKVRRHGKVDLWHYFKIPFMGQESFLVIKEMEDGTKIIHHIQDNKHFDPSKIKNKAKKIPGKANR